MRRKMKTRTKIILGVIGAIILIFAGLVGYGIWMIKAGEKIVHETASGEMREIVFPKIPGMVKVGEERGDCFQALVYLFEKYPEVDVSGQVKEQVKNLIERQGWNWEEEREEEKVKVLKFYSEEKKELERLEFKLWFEEGKGTKLAFKYEGEPCSKR